MRLPGRMRQATLSAMNAPHAPLWTVDLACRRGGRRVFTGLGFRLEAGEGLTILGPNGAGKSSLLRMLAGLVRPAAGAIQWGDADIADDPIAHRARTAYLGHLDAIKPRATVRDHLDLAAVLHGADRAQVPDVAARVGLGALLERPGRLLSAGQRRRVALGRLLLSGAVLWLLDEPTNALDTAGQALLADLLHDHLARGGRFAVATHQPIAVETHMLTLQGS